MATQSSNSPSPDPIQASLIEGQETLEPPLENSQTSVFVNSQPLREEQVENDVKFLSHPRVRGSSMVHRRNFLERKGLTKEEIDEAFQRVPDPSPTSVSDQASAHQGGYQHCSTISCSGRPDRTAAPSGVISTTMRRFHWSHACLAIGFLAISGAWSAIIIKNFVIPRLKSWIRKVVMDEEEPAETKSDEKLSLAEEIAVTAKAAAAAAADVARVSQDMLITKSEDTKCFTEFMGLLNVQIHEMRIIRAAISKLEGHSSTAGRIYAKEDYINGSLALPMILKQPANGKNEFDTRSVGFVSRPASTEPPHPNLYSEITDMVLKGEKPPNVRDIDDRPPNPNSDPNLAPRPKPWEVHQPVGNSTFVPQPQLIYHGFNNTAQDTCTTYQYNNDNPTTWWRHKNARITEIENENVVIDPPPVRRWVPPQPPPVSMPEAAVAIRQPKSIPRDRTLSADEVAQHVSGLEELQRVTKISEYGGQKIEMNEGQDQAIEV